MRHEAIYYGSQGIVECGKCDTAWPCVYEQGWRDGLLEAAQTMPQTSFPRTWLLELAEVEVE